MNTLISPNPPRLAPSILASDHSSLVTDLEIIQSLPVKWLHLDIMDGHFVPNLSFGPKTVADLRKRDGALFFDTHLMLANPHQHLEAFIEAGSNSITIHAEPDYPVAESLRKIREAGCRCGLALNPGTPPEVARPFLEELDMVLVMTVWPGFGGQSFIQETTEKMRILHRWREENSLSFRLEVDGGIDTTTAPLCRRCGVDTLVAGTAFFKADDPASFLREIETPNLD